MVDRMNKVEKKMKRKDINENLEENHRLSGGFLYDRCDGLTAFDGARMLQDRILLDAQALMDYIRELPGGEIGGEYADPYGQGRITIIDR